MVEKAAHVLLLVNFYKFLSFRSTEKIENTSLTPEHDNITPHLSVLRGLWPF